MTKEKNIRSFRLNDSIEIKSTQYATNQVHTTKYTPLTFLFRFLIYELSRPANIFFCTIILIQQYVISGDDKYSTLLPFTGILLFSALKEIYEDLKRSNLDNTANNILVQAVRMGKLVEIRSKDVHVGDIVKCENNERFPADLILISSSEPQGMAYIETSNVDGESNLKIRMSNPRTIHLVNEQAISEFNATIHCEQPNECIYNFEGNIENGKECFSLDKSNILLRGAVLKNTQWIYGIVVYTGHETKIMMNSSETPNKCTSLIRKTDQKYFYLVIGVGILALFGAILNMYYDTQILNSHWYLNISKNVGIEKKWSVISFGRMIVYYIFLLNTLVPISLSVTLEFIKLIMAYLVNQDLELYDAETDSNAVARSSSLMEELGQIQCILTDKTGTLTCNEMILKHLIINGETYLNCCAIGSKLLDYSEINENVDFFLKVMSTCHTVMIDYSDPDHPCYQGSSPDELAMVNVAAELAYKFSKRSCGATTIEICGEPVTVDVFAVIEFTSARKRMSIVTLLPDDNYYIFCKGADSIIIDRLDSESKESQELGRSLREIENFASSGLRTLCFASRKLDKDFALEWLDKWNNALNTVTDRQQHIDSVAQLIETDLTFIGATGVEDRLQYGVPKTIETLMKANIKFWMLTGDRFETAVSTAFLSNLIQASTIQLHLLRNEPDAISKSLDNFSELISKNASASNFALVLSGPVVDIVLSEPFSESADILKFCEIVTKCRTLLCCRLSPLQKSLITKFAREKLGYITLAIGDGGNDVSMIQAANVGIGISGKEGLQASRSADFSIAQFKFLVKLVLVHGSWSLHRLSRVVMYSIYKNIVLFFTQFWFCFYNGFSARSIFEPWMFINWNLLFTCWPPTIIGLTDQYVFARELIENPQLYEFGQKNKFYDSKTFWISAINAISHSLFIFLSVIFMFPDGFILPDGQASTALMLGSTLFAIILSVVCIKVLLFTNYLTFFLGALVVFSAGLWYVYVVAMHNLAPDFLPNASTMELFKAPTFWALVLLIPVAVSLRDFIWKFCRRQFFPHPYHIIQELKLAKPLKEDEKAAKGPTNLIFDGTNKKPKRSRGFSFSQTFGQTRVLTAYGQLPNFSSNFRH